MRQLEQTGWGDTIGVIFDRLDARELVMVRRCVAHAQRRPVRFAALWINRLSNGILYPIVAAVLLALFGFPIVVPIIVAGTTVLAAHLIYPVIKRHCARRRPFECDTTIISLLKPLDRHSFPSGHTMTATAAFLPLSASVPQLAPLAVAGIASIGWARLVAGHHYPSDVVAGVILGSVLVMPGLYWIVY